MNRSRRTFIQTGAAAGLGAGLAGCNTASTPPPVPAAAAGPHPAARIEKARRLMADHRLDAIYLEGRRMRVPTGRSPAS